MAGMSASGRWRHGSQHAWPRGHKRVAAPEGRGIIPAFKREWGIMLAAEAPGIPGSGAVGLDTIPRDYNFAADILERNLSAGRAGKPAFIDPRGSWTYGQLAD